MWLLLGFNSVLSVPLWLKKNTEAQRALSRGAAAANL